ncbi:MAG: Cys-tRNA(Pro) deacylase [Corynebacterium sp.]|nr:Cys-tRNA(Pro) deacylase [Corynebacterium sp.]
MGKKKKTGGATPALLAVADIEHSVHTFEGGTDHFGDNAAAGLDFPAERIFKTLIITDGKNYGVACVPVTGHLSLKRAAEALGFGKLSMADQKKAQSLTGYVPGGISPLGQKRSLPTVIDESATNYPTIMVSGGKRGLDIELAATDLAKLTNAVFGPVAGE